MLKYKYPLLINVRRKVATKKQGYNDRLDERLGMTRGKASTKKQSYKDRRDESRGARKTQTPKKRTPKK